MKVSKKIQTRMKLEAIQEEENRKEEDNRKEQKRLRDLEKTKEIDERTAKVNEIFAQAAADDDLREQVSPSECLKIIKEVVDQFASMPRLQVIELLKTDKELSDEVAELKRQAQVIFKYVPKDHQVRLAVVSLFKISLDIDLELPYVEDKRNKKRVAFDDKVEEIDEERQALLDKLKSKKK